MTSSPAWVQITKPGLSLGTSGDWSCPKGTYDAITEAMFDDRNEPKEKSELEQRMEAFYEEMSKNPKLMAFFTGMAGDAMAENKGEQKEE